MSEISSQEPDVSTHQQQSASKVNQSQTAADSVHMGDKNSNHSGDKMSNDRHLQDHKHLHGNDQKSSQSSKTGEGKHMGGQRNNDGHRNNQTNHSYQEASRSRDNYGRPTEENWHNGNRDTSYRQGGQVNRNGGNLDSYRYEDDDSDFFLSKTLSSILRHNAENYGFKLMKGGFLYVNDILRNMHKLKRYTVKDVQRIVDTNDKKRFALEEEVQADGSKKLKIRANQGHTLQVDELELAPVTSANEFSTVIHGTYYEAWEKIKETGLNRMSRNHIHFAPGEPGHNDVISGMRKTCEVMIYLDIDKALKDDLKFFRSANNVILCPGNKDGIIFPCYFAGAKDRRTGYKLEFDSKICSLPKKADGTTKASTIQANGKTKGSTNNANDKRVNANTTQANGKPEGSTNNANDKTVNANTTQENSAKRKLKKNRKRKDHGMEANLEDEDNVGAKIKEKQGDENNKSKQKEKLVQNEEVKDAAYKETVAAGQSKVENACNRIVEKSSDVKIKEHLTENNIEAEESDDIYEDDQVHSEWEPVPQLMNIEKSVAVVDKLLSDPPEKLAVCCIGEDLDKPDGHIRLLVILVHPNIYVYHLHDGNLDLVKDGHLDKLLAHKGINKIFHDVGNVCPSLIRQFGIQLDSTLIWDSKLMYRHCSPLPHMDIEDLKKYYFHKDTFKQWQTENEKFAKVFSGEDIDEGTLLTLAARGKLMLKLYDCCNGHMPKRIRTQLRTEIFELAIPKDMDIKLKSLKLEQEKESKSVDSKPERTANKQQEIKVKSRRKKKNNKRNWTTGAVIVCVIISTAVVLIGITCNGNVAPNT